MSKASIPKHLLIMLVVTVALIAALFIFFQVYTHHGQAISVPDLKGMELNQVDRMLRKQDLRFEINDSIYRADMPPGVVLDQSPKAGNKVKEGRILYLTVNSIVPPSVMVPNLKDISRRQAILILESLGLKHGTDIYVPDNARDLVHDVKINGRDVTPGTTVLKGSTFDLVLGDGIGGTEMDVPRLTGLMLEEALVVLEALSLLPGIIKATGNISDTMSAYVYFQQPKADTLATIRVGEPVDLFIIQFMADTARLRR